MENPLATQERVNDTGSTTATRRGADDATISTEALETIYVNSWRPVFSFICRKGYGPHDAQDVTQDFLLHTLERNSFAAADPAKGTLLAYVFGALKRFLADRHDRARAAKRGGGIEFISIDDAQNTKALEIEDPSAAASLEEMYDRQWAATVLRRAMTLLEEEHRAAGTMPQFTALEQFLGAKARRGDYESVAAQLRTSPRRIALMVHRMRRRLEELARAQLPPRTTSLSEPNPSQRGSL